MARACRERFSNISTRGSSGSSTIGGGGSGDRAGDVWAQGSGGFADDQPPPF